MNTLEGIVEDIIFSNESNGYTVCEIATDEDTIVAVGCMPFLSVGDSVKVSGKFVLHHEYGEQLKVESYEKILPQSVSAIEKYLASGIVKGVGPATAAKIVKEFGEETIQVLQFSPERLSIIKGISKEKAISIGQAFEEQKVLKNIVMFFQEYGISPTYSTKIYKVFGEKTLDEVKTNPYVLCDSLFGINFKTVDKIAKNIGIDPLANDRICSAIKYVLAQATFNGHTYLPEGKLNTWVSELLNINEEHIKNAILTLMLEKSIYVEKNNKKSFWGENIEYSKEEERVENNIYLEKYYIAEQNVSRRLAYLSKVKFELDSESIQKKLKEIEKEENIELAQKQMYAVEQALNSGLLIITGGPGTGKTTIIKSIVKLLHKEGCSVVLAAPTGRAAKRMTDATGYESKTIHRLLEIGYSGDDEELVFAKNESNLIEADAIIVDETSMVDILIMDSLLAAMSAETRLILVGDVDQLPSVGAGNVLKDIIDSEAINVVKLTEIFRQAKESMIVFNAHNINNGEEPILNKKDSDFYYIPKSDSKDIVSTIMDVCNNRLPKAYKYNPLKDIQVLTPTRKGVVGVANLNIQLQKVLNTEGAKKKEKKFGDYTFREGDRVMQIKNNYNLKWTRVGKEETVTGEGVFNGDTGIIRNIYIEEQIIEVIFDDEKIVDYDFSMLDEIEPAFAVTIHKSQGSEFPVVVMPLYPGPKILMTRNLIYTAITRAKELVVLVGNKNTLIETIKNKRETLRYSGLCRKIKEFKYERTLKEQLSFDEKILGEKND